MKHVLIVDDDPNICKLLDFALRKAGFEVSIAADGDMGLEMAMSLAPDVAVLDVMMPGMHGYELCRRIRANDKTAHAKVVFLTARSQPIDEQSAFKAGADLFLSKPIVPDDLVEHIKSLLLETRSAVPERLEPPPEPVREQKEAPEEAPKEAPVTQPLGRPKGKLVACFSPTKGVGVTTLAVNLALGFAVWQRAQVPLVELHTAQAAVLPALGRPADPHRGNLSATGRNVSWDTLLLHLVEHPSGVRILPAPPAGSDVPAELTKKALDVLRARFPLIVADVEHSLEGPIQPALLSADLILLVTSPDVPSVRATVHALQRLRELEYPQRQVLLVVNSVQAEAAIPVERLQEGLKRPIFGVVPYEPAAPDCLRAGRPLLAANAQSPASQAVGRMTMQLARGLKLARAAASATP